MAHHRGRAFPSSKLARHRRKVRLIYLSIFVVLVGAISWGIVAFSTSSVITITEIKVSGTKVLDQKKVTEIAQTGLKEKYLYFVSRNNTFLYPRAKIKEDIMNAEKRVREVNIAVESNNVLHIELSERKPFALWCKEVKDMADDCYFLDADGFIFAKAPNFYGKVFFKYYDVLGDGDPVGKTYMDGAHLKVVQNFARDVSELGLVPFGLKVRSLGEYDFVLEKGGRIMFSDKDSFDQTLANLETLIGSQPALKDQSNIEFIDLRFGNKLFYKLRNSSILTP